MSHTLPTPLTTLISSTSHALNKTPEPRVPPIYAFTATTPPPDPTPALPSPSQHTHMQHKQQYMHHSHHNNRTPNIGYHDNLIDKPRTTTGLQTPHRPSSKSERNTAGQHKRNQKQTRGAQTAYSRHTCRYHHNSGNQAHP